MGINQEIGVNNIRHEHKMCEKKSGMDNAEEKVVKKNIAQLAVITVHM